MEKCVKALQTGKTTTDQASVRLSCVRKRKGKTRGSTSGAKGGLPLRRLVKLLGSFFLAIQSTKLHMNGSSFKDHTLNNSRLSINDFNVAIADFYEISLLSNLCFAFPKHLFRAWISNRRHPPAGSALPLTRARGSACRRPIPWNCCTARGTML